MVRVFFDHYGNKELAAIFSDVEVYQACIDGLDEIREQRGFLHLTSVDEEPIDIVEVDSLVNTHLRYGKIHVKGDGFEYTIEKDNGVCTSITSNMHINDDSDELYNAAIDGLEAMILACAASGMDVSCPMFVKTVQTALEGISNNID